MRLDTPLETGFVTTHTAQQAFDQVLLYAGCSKERDLIDERIVEETKTGKATYKGSVSSDAAKKPGLIDRPTDVMPAGATSPWPELNDGGVTADQLKDSDGDGMPDAWETANGLNPNDASDGKKTTLSTEGYTNLEVYLNSLVADITEKQNEAGQGGGGTGMKNEPEDAVAVYATAHTVYVKRLPESSRIEVYTYNGTMIQSIQASGTETSFHLPSGIYILRINAKEMANVKKILIP